MHETAPKLHLHPGTAADDGDRVVVTPESAGWRFCGLRVVRLAAGEARELVTEGEELAVLPLAGSVVVEVEGRRFALEGRESVFDGIPSSLPSLLYAHKVVRKAQTLGLDIPTPDRMPTADEIGGALLTIVVAARVLDVDPEAALRAAANELRDRARATEK